MTVKNLQDSVGRANFLDDEEVLEEYSRDASFAPPIRLRCVVKPQKANQVQELVKWVNETTTPLIPINSGGSHFRADTVPIAGGSVIVDLSNKKQIIRIDPENRVAMIEAGVTLSELNPQAEKDGLKLTGIAYLDPAVGALSNSRPSFMKKNSNQIRNINYCKFSLKKSIYKVCS